MGGTKEFHDPNVCIRLHGTHKTGKLLVRNFYGRGSGYNYYIIGFAQTLLTFVFLLGPLTGLSWVNESNLNRYGYTYVLLPRITQRSRWKSTEFLRNILVGKDERCWRGKNEKKNGGLRRKRFILFDSIVRQVDFRRVNGLVKYILRMYNEKFRFKKNNTSFIV